MTDLSFLNTQHPLIMGVLNVTPDSFSDGGALYSESSSQQPGSQQPSSDLILRRVEQMLAEGADIIDVGGESTRPGAEPVSEQQELDRVIPVVEMIRERFSTPVSVDTSTARVMTESIAAGAALINDVRALQRENALQAVAASNIPVCLMHMSDEPGVMQQNPQYSDVVAEVKSFLLERAAACENAGIARDRILLDPGFGFGKTLEHNLSLFRALPEFADSGYPVLVGVSRKTMIGAILNKEVGERVFGSVALALMAVQRGAKIVRVHDVAATSDVIKILAAVEQG